MITPRRLTAILVALAAALTLAAPAAARADDADDAIVVVSGPAVVGPDETVEGVFVAHGDTTIRGTVTGDVWVLSGDTLVSGRIEGDLVTASDPARLLRGAVVEGDILYGDERPVISPGATVEGEVNGEDWNDALEVLPFVGFVALWLAVTISSLVLGIALVMIAPRAADAVFAQAEERMLLCVVFGISIFIAVPLAVLIAAVTLVGLPLAVALLLALLPLALVAYVTTAWVLGRALVKQREGRIVAFLAGLAILRLLALIPVLGGLVWLAATIVGLGLLVGAIGAAREGPAVSPATG